MQRTKGGLLLPSRDIVREVDRRGSRSKLSKEVLFMDRQLSLEKRAVIQRQLYGMIESRLSIQIGSSSTTGGNTFWTAKAGKSSADADYLDHLDVIRSRARQALAANPIVASILRHWVDGVVGSGLVPKVQFSARQRDTIGITEEQADQLSWQMEENFRRWSRLACISGRLSYGQCQRQAAMMWALDGEVFKLRRAADLRRGRKLSYAIQTVPADRVDNPGIGGKSDDQRDRAGVRIDPSTGEHLGYHIASRSQDDYSIGSSKRTFSFVEAFDGDIPNVWQILSVERDNQTRGLPILAASLEMAETVMRIVSNEAWAQEVASCFVLFRTVADPSADVAAAQSSKEGDDEIPFENFGPGIMGRLGPNEKVEGFKLDRPGNAWDQFIGRTMKMMTGPTRMPHEMAANDWSGTTYTSGRMAMNIIGRAWDYAQQGVFVPLFCEDDFALVTEEAILRGLIPEPPAFLENRDLYLYDCVRWQGPSRFKVQPDREMKAESEMVDAGLLTRSETLLARGRSPEEFHQERLREADEDREVQERKNPAPEPEQPSGGGQDPEGGGDPGGSQDDGDATDFLAAQATKLLVDSAGVLIRSGFEAGAALAAVGLDPIKHLGLLPVTLQPQKGNETGNKDQGVKDEEGDQEGSGEGQIGDESV